MNKYNLIDYITKQKVSPKNLVFTGKDHPWEVVCDLEQTRKRLDLNYFRQAPPSMGKYLPFLPVDDYQTFISLNEGSTPLTTSRVIGPELGINLMFKHEGTNPTGSFKDRGTAVEVTTAKQLNAPAIVLASTGNMAASASCYAAAAGIPCFVFVPEGTPTSKLAQVLAYGGKIVQVKGTYDQASKLATQAANDLGFYLSGDYAFRAEGQKTIGYEIADQLSYHIPDVIICPIGVGTNISAIYKGFKEYHELGLTDKIPQIIGVEAAGADAIVRTWEQGREVMQPLDSISTLASAIAVANPYDAPKVFDAFHTTSGGAIRVTDQEILQSQYQLAKQEGIFAEASSATTLAALIKLTKNNRTIEQSNNPPHPEGSPSPSCHPERSETQSKDPSRVTTDLTLAGPNVCLILTGNGLKDPSTILKVALKPPTIAPNIDNFMHLYKAKHFDSKSIVFLDHSSILFKDKPTREDITNHAQTHFSIELSADYVKAIQTKINQFLTKGKHISLTDFQDILQDTMENPPTIKDPKLQILDYQVQATQDTPPQATVKLKLHNQELNASSTGTGPVDAIISAISKAINVPSTSTKSSPKALQPQSPTAPQPFSLTDYNVEIRSRGTDAVVFVQMKLSQNGSTSLGQSTSPDIIQASIQAFQSAYNGFS